MSRTAAGLLVIFLASAWRAEGQWEGQRLCATGLPGGGEFGSSVAIGDGGTIAVGDFRHDVVVLFHWDTVTGCRQLATIRGASGEWFGFDLAVAGDRLLVGAPKAGGTGAAYLIDLDDPELRRTALAVTPARNGDEIGSAVAMDGNFLAIGARGADDRRGRVYAGGAGDLKALPAPPGLAQRAELGQSVALSGTTLVMGAPSPFRGSGSPGAAWVFDVPNEEFVSLAPPGWLEPEAAFGYAVAVDRDRILVGAPLADRNGVDAGAVLSFEGGQVRELGFPSRSRDQLGVAVALEEGIAVAGARYADGTRGAAYLIERNGPPQTLEQTVPGGAQFGFSVAIRRGLIVAGAFRERGTGAAYVFTEAVPPLHLEPIADIPESTRAVTVILRAVQPAPRDITVRIATEDGTARSEDGDYAARTESVTLPAGQTEVRKSLPIVLQDQICEGKETFGVVLFDPPEGEAVQTVPVTIVDDDPGGLELAPASLSTSEIGTPVPLSIRLTCPPSRPVRVSLEAGLASFSPADLTFTPADWSQPRTVSVTGADNAACGPPVAPYEIHATTASRDARYAGLSQSIPAGNADDERACLFVAARTVCADGFGTVVYTISLANSLSGVADVPARLDDLLPPGVSVVTASADRGTATTDTVANSVRWTGPVPAAGDEVTITIVAALDGPPGPELDNEAEVTYDRDGRGQVETFPVVFGAGDVVSCSP